MYKKTKKKQKIKYYIGGDNLNDNNDNDNDNMINNQYNEQDLSEKKMEELLTTINDGGVDISIKIAKMAVSITNDFISNSIDYILGTNINEKSFEDLFRDSKEKIIKLIKLSYSIIIDKETQDSAKELLIAVLEMINDTLIVLDPFLKQVTQELTKTLKEVSSTAAVGAIRTGLASSQAAISEIPVMGGIINLGIAAGKGFDAASKTFEKSMKNIDKITYLMNEATSQSIPPVVKGVKQIQEAKEKLKNSSNRIQSSINQTQNISNSNLKGGFKNKKKYNYKNKTRKL